MIRSLAELIREVLTTHNPSRDELEEIIFREAIRRYLNATRAAHSLGVTRQTIANRMRKYKISMADLKAEKELLRRQLQLPTVKKF